MKDTDTIGVADGEGQDMGEAQTEACVPVSELREAANELKKESGNYVTLQSGQKPTEYQRGGMDGIKWAAQRVSELADKYDSNE